MSVIFVQTGQCGNQLGYELIDSISALANTSSGLAKEKLVDKFFRHSSRQYNAKLIARTVCLDTEPKVINDSVSKAHQGRQWSIDTKSVAYLHGGAGNNWAHGYEMCSGEFSNTAIDCVRREIEYCDQSPTLVLTQSLAGGTGSGMGTRLTEVLGEKYVYICMQ